ncbi:MAG TPA: plastocyanin/azurin family copper-binding protein [Thermoanaerobaculia bacterium]
MRHRHILIGILLVSVVAFPVEAKDVFLPIAGSVGVFRTDTRILNPSFTSDITVTARFLPAGNPPAAAPVVQTFAIPRRQMAVYDDVVSTLFHTTGLGAIQLTSESDFVASQRIYAATSDGTLGQFVLAQEAGAAKKKGLLIQLKSSGTAGQKGTFRTNAGFVNPNSVVANVTLRLYDKSNAVIGAAKALVLQPLAVLTPSNIVDLMQPPAGDLRDAWISFTSDESVFAYGSVVDNGTTDPTFIAAFDDSGTAPAQPPPAALTVNVGPDFQFNPKNLSIVEGDTVTWQFFAQHTTTSNARTGPEVWDSGVKNAGESFSREFTTPGTYAYYCTLHSTAGGTAMNGVITVRAAEPPYKK